MDCDFLKVFIKANFDVIVNFDIFNNILPPVRIEFLSVRKVQERTYGRKIDVD